MPFDMQHEPIRLPAIVTAVILTIVPPVAAILLGADPAEAIGTALLGLTGGSTVVAAAESKRARTDSPATLIAAARRNAAELEAIAAEQLGE